MRPLVRLPPFLSLFLIVVRENFSQLFSATSEMICVCGSGGGFSLTHEVISFVDFFGGDRGRGRGFFGSYFGNENDDFMGKGEGKYFCG